MAARNKKRRLAILVGGGPAPGINGVISAATMEAVRRGWAVIGVLDGWKWLISGDLKHVVPLGVTEVSRIHFTGGVNGGVKVRRVADQNRGTQALFTPLTAGCQTFFIS